jgi:hypothetical protein
MAGTLTAPWFEGSAPTRRVEAINRITVGTSHPPRFQMNQVSV